MTRPLLLLFLFLAPPAPAHEELHPLTRFVLVEATEAGTRVTAEVSALLVYAKAAAQRRSPKDVIEAPFLQFREGPGRPRYLLDTEALGQKPTEAAGLVAPILPLHANGAEIRVVSARASHPGADKEVEVVDATIEVVLLFPDRSDLELAPIDEPPRLPPDWFMLTVLTDARRTPAVITERIGPLRAPVLIPAP
ncbi:MAG: hypothetical protein AAGA32_03155 [Pseudomonadota bacterium]